MEQITDLKGLVIAKWEANGRPPWSTDRTIREVEIADQELATRGRNPAPALRRRRLARDAAYVRTWTLGCHFEWLNPR